MLLARGVQGRHDGHRHMRDDGSGVVTVTRARCRRGEGGGGGRRQLEDRVGSATSPRRVDGRAVGAQRDGSAQITLSKPFATPEQVDRDRHGAQRHRGPLRDVARHA